MTLLAVLGPDLVPTVVPADTPILRADDLGAVRGDGVFETANVRGGRPWLLDAHLDRMARSAAALDLALPAREALVALADTACRAWPAADEGALRIVCTRGPESGGPPTVYATLNPITDHQRAKRRSGVAVRTLPLGIPVAVRTAEPALLAGAKTLSYAVNMACQRWATAHGADDVLWVSADGYALEAPTSSLVWLRDGVLCTVPPAETGILAGTTAAHLLSRAGELGWTAREQLVRPAELADAQGVWLTSSARGPVEVRSLDDTPLGPSPETTRITKLLGFPT
ncbi:aminotransferase class IV [Pseudonocardia humida]|uniref:Aminotransferase class IV n=1 Tax=Pseudonocardia humida TaxID=2800819 RepID=A0ABT0ZT72_9PSEU|nr:aminotransferase class IV [Pseudonocardia humida]MCO1653936.1 aminotransferase class IV [Pseudonocardia humida]